MSNLSFSIDFPAKSPAFPMRQRYLRGKLLELPGNTVAGAQENIGRTYDVAPWLMEHDEHGCWGSASPEDTSGKLLHNCGQITIFRGKTENSLDLSKEVWKLNFRQYGQMEKHHSHGEDQRWRKSEERRCRCAKR